MNQAAIKARLASIDVETEFLLRMRAFYTGDWCPITLIGVLIRYVRMYNGHPVSVADMASHASRVGAWSDGRKLRQKASAYMCQLQQRGIVTRVERGWWRWSKTVNNGEVQVS